MFLCSLVVFAALVLASLHEQMRRWRDRHAAIRAFGAAQHELIRGGGQYTMDDVVRRATAIMLEFTPHLSSFSRKRSILRWAVKTLDTGSLFDAPRSGRVPKISNDDAREVVRQIRQGYTVDGRLRPFPDLRTAIAVNPVVRDLVARAQYQNMRGLQHRLHEIEPKLKRRHINLKPELKAHQKLARMAACKDLKRRDLDYLKRVFFIDAKTLYCEPEAGYALVHQDDLDMKLQTDPRLRQSFQHAKKIKFYAVANWHFGVCMWWFCDGTSDRAPRFKVCYTCTHAANHAIVA
jgi:hypothetical protein